MRIALNAGAAPMKAAAVSQAPSELGHLKKAMRIKIKSYRGGVSWVAAIGASKSYKRTRKLKNKKLDRGGSKEIRPSKYQPLVNEGTKNVKAQHFMESAFRSAKAQFEQNVMRKLREIIPQLIARR